MSEIFKQIATPQAPQEPTPAVETPSDVLQGNETKAQDNSILNLEIWEGENRRKFGEDLLNIREIAHEFNIKMDFSKIDKFIKSEMTKRSYENTTENYKRILIEIESEIGSANLDTFSRLKKLAGYAQAIQKLYAAKEAKAKFLIGGMSD